MTTLYFEDFKPGQCFKSNGRTITEADLTQFSMISGDWHPIHCDVEYAKKTRFGVRVVHGVLGVAIAAGMMHELGIFTDSIIAMTTLDDWKFLKPIFVGDTLRLELEILDVEETTKSLSNGKLLRQFKLLNQNDEIVQLGASAALVLRRTALEKPVVKNTERVL